MQIEPQYIRQETSDDGVVTQTRWGYCRVQNAVRLGYCANILAALVGLILVYQFSRAGLLICSLVGASFGCAYVAEQLQSSPLRPYTAVASIVFTISAYMVLLALALGG